MKIEKIADLHETEPGSGLEDSLAKKIEAEEKQSLFEDNALPLTGEEKEWFKQEAKDMDEDSLAGEISFKASATCICGKTGCTGCAGVLIDKKIGCQSGACTGGTRIPK